MLAPAGIRPRASDARVPAAPLPRAPDPLQDPLAGRALRDPLDPPVVQAKIKTKDGANYPSHKSLPLGFRKNAILKPLASSKETWLALTAADVVERGRGGKPPLLTPHRHVIGEEHDASRFDEAIANWGFGATKMAEGFQTSTEVTDSITEKNQRQSSWIFWPGPYNGTRALENLHAYTLQGIALLRFVLHDLREGSNEMQRLAGNVVMNPGAGRGAAVAEFNQGEASMGERRASVRSQYADAVATMLPNYQQACAAVLIEGQPVAPPSHVALYALAQDMVGLWDLKSAIKVLTNCPYSSHWSWTDTHTAYGDRVTGIDAFRTNVLDVWAAGLVSLAQAEAAVAVGNNSKREGIASAWQAGTATRNARTMLLEVSKIREIFMAQNISQLDKPSIIKTGSAHVTGMRGKIAGAKFYDSYADFVEGTTA